MRLVPEAAAAVVLVSLLATSAGIQAQNTDPFVGTWKLDVAKSKSTPGPSPKGYTRTDEDRGGELIVVTVQGLDGQGKETFTQFAWRYDGKEYPYSYRGIDVISSIAGKRVDATTVEFSIKERGKIVGSGTQAVSADGKTLTRIAKGTDGSSSVLVYQRQ